MESLALLWDFAPSIKIKLIYLALAFQFGLTIYCYSALAKARVRAVREERISPDDYKAVHTEPDDVRVFTRAVANQFEFPVLFYALVLAFVAGGISSWITVVLVWLFVILRFVHAREMISDNRVLLRRKVFIRSVQVFLLLLVEFVLATLFLLQV